jgi:uncharacterized membrane protein
VTTSSRAHIHLPQNIGEKVADTVTGGMGSWKFIIIQTIIVFVWMGLNSIAWFWHWDPMPFILLNLVFSTQAAYASPLILMSQNRQTARDHARDDLEAKEVQELFDSHQLLLQINQQQLTMLKQQAELLEFLK